MAKEMDAIDILIQVGIFGSYIVFAVCVWFLRKDLRRWLKIDKKKDTKHEGKGLNDY